MRIAFPIHMMPWDAEPSHGIGRYMAELAGALHAHSEKSDLRLTIFQDAYAPAGPFDRMDIERFPSIRDLLGRPAEETHRHAENLTRASTGRDDDAPPSLFDRARMHAREILRVRHLRAFAPDLVHYAMHVGHPPAPRGIPLVITVHDLVPHLYPETIRKDVLFGWKQFLRARAGADAFIAVSQAVADDLSRHLDIAPDKIHVVHEGVDGRFQPPAEPENLRTRLGERYGFRSPYVLHVGTIEPRKNLETLVRAMETIPSHVSLVLAGNEGWRSAAVRQAIEDTGLGSRVHLPGRIEDDDLPGLYGCAAVVAFPSHYEGFGLPTLEAMASGAPIVCADIPALREVGGDGPLFVDAADAPGFGQAINAFLDDPELTAAHRSRGLARAAEFTWEATARSTVQVYESVIESHDRG